VLRNLSDKFDIVVEGHTDNVPIYTRQFASNWELSTARSTNLVKLLLENNFKPKRLAAVGYGENHPIVPNDSEINRKKNRRVVFFIKNTPYPEAKSVSAADGDKKAVISEEGAETPDAPAPAVETPAAEEAQAQASSEEAPANNEEGR
jgi:chemotaxis protein MotB